MTDDLDMDALDGDVPERAAASIEAGCDVVLNCWADMEDMLGIAHQLPAISDKAAARLERLLAGTALGAGRRRAPARS